MIRKRGSGGIFDLGGGRWRVDIELPREPGAPRRRKSRTLRGSYADAESELARLSEIDRPPTVAHSVRIAASVDAELSVLAARNRNSIAQEIRTAISEHLRKAKR